MDIPLIADRFEPLGPVVSASPIKARDLETAQTVVLVPAKKLDPRTVGVCHPALLTVFAIVEHEGEQLAATEYVQSRPLGEVFGGEPCHPRRAAEIVSELADGLAELHARDIAHGQISLSTTVLTARGKANLAVAAAIGGDVMADLRRLKQLHVAIGGRPSFEAEHAESAAALAALLRA